MTPSEASRELARAVALIRKVGRRVAVSRAATIVAATVVVLWTAGLLMPSQWEQPGSAVPMLAVLWVLGGAALGGLTAGSTIRAFRPALKTAEIEEARGLGTGELLAALELGEETGGSAALARLHRLRTAAKLEGRATADLLPRSREALRAATGAAAPALGLAFVLLGVGLHGDRPLTTRTVTALVRPWAITFPPPPPPISVSPPGGEVVRGSLFAFRVFAAERERVYVARGLRGRPLEYDTLPVASGVAEGRFAVGEEIQFWVRDDEGSASDTFRVTPVDPVTITEFTASLRYPGYLERPDEVLRGPLPSLQVPRGTAIDFSVRANHPLHRLGLSRASESETDTVWLRAEGNRADGGIVATNSAYLSWLPVAEDGVPENRTAPGIRLTVEPDAPPAIRFVQVGGDATFGVDGRLPLVLEAEDDHGLARVELVWWRESATGLRESPDHVPLLGDDGPRHVVLHPVLDLAEADLLPGDVIAYYAAAADRDRRKPPVTTDTFRVATADVIESHREASRQAEGLAGELRSLQTRTFDLGEAARDAERRVAREGSAVTTFAAGEDRADFSASEEARDLLREAEAIRDEVERNAGRLEELRDRAAGEPWPDPEVQRRLGELERLFEEIRRSGLADEIEALERALERLDRADLRDALASLSTRSADLSAQLERAVGLMERVALEQSLEAARQSAADLSARQRRESEARTRDGDWVNRQEAIAAEADDLAASLDALSERLEAEDAVRASRTGREAAGEVLEAAGQMRAAAGAEDRERGARSARAADAMQRAERSLSRASRQLAEDWGTDARDAVAKATGEALELAREQAEVAQGLRSGEATEDLARRQSAVREGLDNLTRSLAEAGRKTALLDRRSGPAAARAGHEMDAAGESLSGGTTKRSEATRQAESATEALADLAGSLLDSQRAMQGASTGTGMEEALRELARLGQRQGSLNAAAGDLFMLMRDGGRPADQLEGLSAGQREVAVQLDRLAGDPAARELAARPGELAAEAEAIARELESGALRPETLARQERLFRRLLDAGRTLQQDEQDPSRREATSARGTVVFRPTEREDVQAGRRYPYPTEESMEGLSAAQRRLVYDYFDRLNRSTAQETSP